MQHFDDLVVDRGHRAAWARTGVDLIVTVPLYRLESIMNEQHSLTTVNTGIALLAAVGVLGVMTGVLPGAVPSLFLVASVGLAVAQRSTLARAIRAPGSNRRRRRLLTAAVLALVFVTSYGAFVKLIGDQWTVRETVLTAIGTLAMVGSIVYFIIGLLTPRALENSGATRIT